LPHFVGIDAFAFPLILLDLPFFKKIFILILKERNGKNDISSIGYLTHPIIPFPGSGSVFGSGFRHGTVHGRTIINLGKQKRSKGKELISKPEPGALPVRSTKILEWGK
jgi:hypothetical protein